MKTGIALEFAATEGFRKRELLEPANRYRLAIAFGLFLGQQCTGMTVSKVEERLKERPRSEPPSGFCLTHLLILLPVAFRHLPTSVLSSSKHLWVMGVKSCSSPAFSVLRSLSWSEPTFSSFPNDGVGDRLCGFLQS